MRKLILASQSPRRKELLSRCGIPFSCVPADIDEHIDETKDLKEEVIRLSFRKAEKILEEYPDAVVIGSDTIVVADNRILGKPESEADAREMMSLLSGRTHHVMTGLAIVSAKKKYTDISVSEVTFQKISPEELDAYILENDCMDKAGAYAIQGAAGKFITNISGDYYAIMGLPLHLVYAELKKIGEY